MTTQTNETTYTTTEVKIKNTIYKVTVVKGKSNYVNVSKKIHMRSMGKDFVNFDAAVRHYKNPQLKIELLKIELELN